MVLVRVAGLGVVVGAARVVVVRVVSPARRRLLREGIVVVVGWGCDWYG
jgi:hypothetical protein